MTLSKLTYAVGIFFILQAYFVSTPMDGKTSFLSVWLLVLGVFLIVFNFSIDRKKQKSLGHDNPNKSTLAKSIDER